MGRCYCGNAVEAGCAVYESVCAHGVSAIQSMKSPPPKCRVLEGAQGGTNRESPGIVVVSPGQRGLQVHTDASGRGVESDVYAQQSDASHAGTREDGYYARVTLGCLQYMPTTALAATSGYFEDVVEDGKDLKRGLRYSQQRVAERERGGRYRRCCTTLGSGHDTGTKREGGFSTVVVSSFTYPRARRRQGEVV